jgi:predicted AAA+ superfamily ATPase
MLRRHIESTLRRALSDRPVVLLQGARQVGKTTLVQLVAEHGFYGGPPPLAMSPSMT